MWRKIFALILGLVIGYWLMDDFDPGTLKGKRVLVTGASAGIGEQMAYQYAKFGASVVVTARREHLLQKVVAKCRKEGNPNSVFGYVTADMTNLTSTEYVIEEAVKQMGSLDILVLNHILPHPLALWQGSQENLTLLHVLTDVNLRSYIHLSSHAMKYLTGNQGSIIVMSSLAGKLGMPFIAPYSATKSALFGFYTALSSEFVITDNPTSITMAVIGLVGTESTIQTLSDFGNSDIFQKLTPADPSDVALAVIRGGALREREIFYPYFSVKIVTLLRDWFPGPVNTFIRLVTTPTSIR